KTTGLAFHRPASKIEPPPWGATTVSYERLVQPVLDRHCGSCHQGEGKARTALDLTLRTGHGPFKEPYLTLVGQTRYGPPVAKPTPDEPSIAGAVLCENFEQSDPASYSTFRPLQHLSCTSKLVRYAASGEHYEVRVDPVGLRQLIGWVDANCPYRGEEEIRQLDDPTFAGIELLPVRPRLRTAPIVARP
ncbi:MAG: hypothetical protein ACC645_27630, partial [Pirellulales bacterium]